MKVIVVEEFGGFDSLVIENLPEPLRKPGSVPTQVKAFGINHAETHVRKGEWAESAKVTGIEFVGIVKSCPGGEFAEAGKLAAFVRDQAARSTGATPITSAPCNQRDRHED